MLKISSFFLTTAVQAVFLSKNSVEIPPLSEFSDILGAGGFGVVKAHPEQPLVVKYIMKASQCTEAKKEFEKQRKAFDALQNFYSKSNDFLEKKDAGSEEMQSCGGVAIPQPISFVDCSSSNLSSTDCKTAAEEFESQCFVIMERVFSDREDGVSETVLLNTENMQHFGDRIMMANYSSECNNIPSSKVLTPEEKKKCKPRGAVLSFEKLQQKCDSIETIATSMAILESTIFNEAKMKPIDVEYVFGGNSKLGAKNTLYVMDFGMVEELSESPHSSSEKVTKEQLQKYAESTSMALSQPIDADDLGHTEFKSTFCHSFNKNGDADFTQCMEILEKEWN